MSLLTSISTVSANASGTPTALPGPAAPPAVATARGRAITVEIVPIADFPFEPDSDPMQEAIDKEKAEPNCFCLRFSQITTKTSRLIKRILKEYGAESSNFWSGKTQYMLGYTGTGEDPCRTMVSGWMMDRDTHKATLHGNGGVAGTCSFDIENRRRVIGMIMDTPGSVTVAEAVEEAVRCLPPAICDIIGVCLVPTYYLRA